MWGIEVTFQRNSHLAEIESKQQKSTTRHETADAQVKRAEAATLGNRQSSQENAPFQHWRGNVQTGPRLHSFPCSRSEPFFAIIWQWQIHGQFLLFLH